LLSKVDLIRKAESPSIRQPSDKFVRKYALGVCSDAGDMWIAAEQRHGECFRGTDTVWAREEDDGTTEARLLTNADHEALGRRVMIRITDVVTRGLLPCQIV